MRGGAARPLAESSTWHDHRNRERQDGQYLRASESRCSGYEVVAKESSNHGEAMNWNAISTALPSVDGMLCSKPID